MESLSRWESADTGYDRPADAAERQIDMDLNEGESDNKSWIRIM